MNILLAFLILGAVVVNGPGDADEPVAKERVSRRAAGVLEPGDRIVSVDGRRGGLRC